MDRRLVALVVLAALAGCGGVIGADDPTTVTPAPVVTPQPVTDAGPRAVAPGVTAEGIQDVDALFEHHLAVLEDTSYTWRVVYREEGFGEPGRFRMASTRTMAVDARGEGLAFRSDRRRELSGGGRVVFTRERYGTESFAFERTGSNRSEAVEYRRLGRPLTPRSLALPEQPVRHVIVLRNQTVSRVDVGERPHFEILGSRSGITARARADEVGSRVVVREDGLIRSVSVSFLSPVYGEPVPNEYTLTYTDVGTTTVEPPAWLAEARAAG